MNNYFCLQFINAFPPLHFYNKLKLLVMFQYCRTILCSYVILTAAAKLNFLGYISIAMKSKASGGTCG